MQLTSKDQDLKRGVDYIGVTCVFFCHDGKGNVFMTKRSKACRDEHGTWDCGAGAMEFGETLKQTVLREVKEEYGVVPKKIEFVHTRSNIREHDGKKTHWVVNLHYVQIDPREVKIQEPHKVDEIGWFPIDRLPEPLHSAIPYDVQMIKAFLNKTYER